MRKYLLTFVISMLTVLGVAGIANALPTALTGSDGTTYNTWTGSAGNAEATFDYNSIVGTGAEHKYTVRPANSSYGPHGKFTTDTNACGRCHQLHQAKSSRLIRFDITSNTSANNPIYGICTYCHNFNGQSTYDVKDGMIWDANDGIRYATQGGGFERQLVVEGPPQLATLVKASSSHQVNKALNGTEYIRFAAPGGDQNGGAKDEHIALKCSSCHNPHGSSNARILVENVVTYDAAVGAPTTTKAAASNIPQFVANRFGDEQSSYPDDISNFCGACHTDYLNTNVANAGNAGSVQTGTYDATKYRHMINMAANNTLNAKGSGGRNDSSFGYDASTLQLPLGSTNADPINNPGNIVVCTTCHFAHGTGAEMTNDIVNNTTNTNPAVSTNSAGGQEYYLLTGAGSTKYETIKNLRMDNRAVCQNCHNRDSVDATAPNIVAVKSPASTGATGYNAVGLLNDNEAKYYATAANKYVTIRFDQYMAKALAEDETNYQFGGAGLETIAGATATLMPDGRTVLIKLPLAAVVNPTVTTVVVESGVKNINNVSVNAADATATVVN